MGYTWEVSPYNDLTWGIYVFWEKQCNNVLWSLSHHRWPIDFWGRGSPHIFSEFYKIYWAQYCCWLAFLQVSLKSKSTTILGPINFAKFWKYLLRSATSKVDGSPMMTKRSEHIITPFLSKYVNTPSQVVATLCMATTTTVAHIAMMATFWVHWRNMKMVAAQGDMRMARCRYCSVY